ncbi:MAG: hypothetical protein B7Y81_04250 [Caulobacter sp. 32-67-35]|nr:MAG: hypothetical protein B7Y81_04250 [Caulobacter sp. 32-67-35]
MAAPTRRALFGAGLAVAAISAPAAAFGTAAEDAALFTLIRALKAAGDAHAQADVASTAAYQRYKQLLGQPPGALRKRTSDWFAGLPVGDDVSEPFYGDLDACLAARDALLPRLHYPIPAAHHARCVEVVGALTAYRKRAQAAEREANAVAAEAAAEHALEAEDAILDQIRAYRPKTREGFAAKAEVAARFIDDQDALNAYGTKWAQAILADVQPMRSPLSS